MSGSTENPIIFYDGLCGLCNRFNQLVLRRDRKKIFRFASLQSVLGAEILKRHSRRQATLDTVCVVLRLGQANETLLTESDAVVFILRQLGGVWRFAAGVFGVLPRGWRDAAYRVVARNRYRLFGRYDVCPMPAAEEQERFLDI